MPIDLTTWEIVNPLNDCTFNQSGGLLSIAVPAGTVHDQWTTNTNAAKLLQVSNNEDFSIQTKLTAAMSAQYQMAGLIVQQDATNFLRFDLFHDGTTLRVFCATVVGATRVNRLNKAIVSTFPIDLRLERVGNNWTLLRSTDGLNWVEELTFTYTMTVSKAGLFAGNNTPSPAYTALFDYYLVDAPRNGITASLSIDEDFQDTANIGGNVIVTGFISPDEFSESDDGYFEATVLVAGQLSATENLVDTLSVTAKAGIQTSFNITENFQDSAQFLGYVTEGAGRSVIVNATEEFSDSAQWSGTVAISGAVNAVENFQDSAYVVVQANILGQLSATENLNDVVILSALALLTSRIATTEDFQDIAAFAATNNWTDRNGVLNATEDFQDSCAFAAKLTISGSLTATENSQDTADFLGYVEWPELHAALNASEDNQDLADFSAQTRNVGILAVSESFIDTADFSVQTEVTGNLSVTESFADHCAWTIKAIIGAAINANENFSDSAEFHGVVRWPDRIGQLHDNEDFFDVADFVFQIAVIGAMNISDTMDHADIGAQVSIQGSFDANENLQDQANFAMKKNLGWIDGQLNVKPAIEGALKIHGF